MDVMKLINVSSINIIWVFGYTAQKQEIKYQKKAIKRKDKIKNKAYLIFKQSFILVDF